MAISPETQRVLDNYAASVGGVQDTRYVNIISVIQNSPSLEHALNQATRDGTLAHIRLDSGLGNRGMGGSYNAGNKSNTWCLYWFIRLRLYIGCTHSTYNWFSYRYIYCLFSYFLWRNTSKYFNFISRFF